MYIQTNNYNGISHKANFSRKKVFNPHRIEEMAQILNLRNNDVYKHTREMSVEQFNFFQALTDKYNEMYFYAQEKEDPKKLFKIINTIPNPQKIHHAVLNSISAPFDTILTVLKNATDKKDVNFIINLQKDIFKSKKYSDNILTDILTSANKEEYIENISKYKSYLRINQENPNAIKELDKMIADGTYNRSAYENELNLSNLKKQCYIETIMSDENLNKYYSKSGVDFIRTLNRNYHADYNSSVKSCENILKMYQTSTSENIGTRKYLMNKYKNFAYEHNQYGEEIDAMNSLFEKIGKNKYTQKFIDEYLQDIDNVTSFQELNNIFENVIPDKGYIFHKNFARIINITKPGAERNRALKEELTNLSYETEISRHNARLKKDAIKYGIARKESKISKLYAIVENTVNKLRYYYINQNNIKKGATAEVKLDLKSSSIPVASPEPKITKFESVINKDSDAKNGIKLVNTIGEAQQNKKIKLQKEIQEFIRKRLHEKTIEEQGYLYETKVTKMRLKMLPEIFASIKETRAADRAAGIKRPKISNKDAIDLYTRIKGPNKKLVNYMLKIRKADGTRVYNINDIMDTLFEANKKIILEKLKPAEAKSLYESIYLEKVEQFGKLTRRNTSKQ